MNISSLWKPRRKRRSVCSRSRVSCVSGGGAGAVMGHNLECFNMQRRMEQFDSLLSAEHSRIQEHIEELSELRCELKNDCECRTKFDRQLLKMEKRVMKLRAEMQDCRKYLLDSDSYLTANEQRQRELQHRLQELWNLITDCCQMKDLSFAHPATVVEVKHPVAAPSPPPATT